MVYVLIKAVMSCGVVTFWYPVISRGLWYFGIQCCLVVCVCGGGGGGGGGGLLALWAMKVKDTLAKMFLCVTVIYVIYAQENMTGKTRLDYLRESIHILTRAHT